MPKNIVRPENLGSHNEKTPSGLIDIHTHILPGVDDGAQDLADSLAMARAFVSSGFETVVATPHVIPGIYENGREKILEDVAMLQQALKREEIPLTVLPGGEYHINTKLPKDLSDGKLVTLGDAGSHLLVELPMHELPPFTEDVLFGIQLAGVTPIIAHPERNDVLFNDPEKLAALVRKGVLSQLTAGCITGLFGPLAKRIGNFYIKKGLTHFIATDAHRAWRRLEAGGQAAEMLGEQALILMRDNPRAVLAGAAVEVAAAAPQPEPKKWGSLFRRFFP